MGNVLCFVWRWLLDIGHVATVCRVHELWFQAVGWAYRTCMQDTLYVFRPKQWLTVTPLIEAIPWRCIDTVMHVPRRSQGGCNGTRPRSTMLQFSLADPTGENEITHGAIKDHYCRLLRAVKKLCNFAGQRIDFLWRNFRL